jgi:tRNA G18 (ribose-2'-O)-methylase SpoU
MERIESLQNPRVKAAKALHTVKGRDRSGLFLCEGEHMVAEAARAAGQAVSLSAGMTLGSAFAVDTLFVDEEQAQRYAGLIGEARAEHAYLVPAYVLAAISTVKSPQGIAAVVRLQSPRVTASDDLGATGLSPAAFGLSPVMEEDTERSAEDALWPDAEEDGEEPEEGEDAAQDEPVSPSVLGDKLVLMEAVQDPGNVGAILRTMDAAGFNGAILTPGCADPYAPKALRATMGAIFRIPTLQAESAVQAVETLKMEGYAVVAAELGGADFFERKPLGNKVCLIIGNEGAGITKETLAAATHRYRLPMKGGAESLNAAAAAAIMIYEIAFRN